MTKTKILFLALILAALGSFLFTSNAQAGTKYEYVIKLLFDNPFTVCCDLSPASCIADKGPVTPENVTTYYPNPVTLFDQSEYEQLLASQASPKTYSEEIALCLDQSNSNCSLGVCPAATKQPAIEADKTCSIKQSCADPGYFCTPEIIASNGYNVCVPKFTAPHPCLQSFQCQSGSCIKYDYVCAQTCSGPTSCPDKYFCSPGNTCEPQLGDDKTCKSNSACLSEVCYFGICQEVKTCSTDADCDENYYCRTEKTPKICKEKKYSWESCTKDNECLSGKCLNQVCIIIDDQCKQDYNCKGDQYCDISSSPKKCVSKKASGIACTDAKQCLSGECDAGKCTVLNECNLDKDCLAGFYCDTVGNLKKCVAQLKEGEKTCSKDTQCASGLICTNTFCLKPAMLGDNCQFDSQCLTKYCNLSSLKCEINKLTGCQTDNDCLAKDYYTYCDNQTLSCKSKKADGENCEENGECKSGTCSTTGKCAKMGGGCYEDKDCSEGKKCNLASHLCEEATPETCEVAGGLIKLKCTVDQYCSVGMCVNKKDVGEECEIGGNCKENFCNPDKKKCEKPPICGNYSTVKELEYDEECEIGYDPGTGTAYDDKSCVNCKVIPAAVTGCTEDKVCGKDYYCDTTADPKKCKSKLQLYSYCTTNNQCLSDYCDTTGVSTGTGSAGCAAKPKEGAAGAGPAGAKPTAPIACDDKKYGTTKCPASYYCDGQLCQFLKIAGANCGSGGECLSNVCAAGDICGCLKNNDCAFGEYCDNIEQICEKLGTAASGNLCNLAGDTDEKCVKGKEYCDTGSPQKCQLKKKPGESCSQEYECLSKICTDTTGNKICGCSSNNECETGFFCDNADIQTTAGTKSDKCVAKFGPDGVCVPGEDFVCQSGKCSDDGKCTEPTAEQAGAAQIKSIELPNFLGETDFAVVVGRVIEFIIGLVGAAAMGMFLYGGTLWLVSRGEAEMLKKGRETMIWAVIGLAVVFTSFILVNFILKVLGSTAAQ